MKQLEMGTGGVPESLLARVLRGTVLVGSASLLAILMTFMTGCGGGGGGETVRTVTLLTEDGPSVIVVSTTVGATTTIASATTVPGSTTPKSTVDLATASETSMQVEPEPGPAESTTTTQVVKETVPLAEEDVPAGLKMMDALEEFNGCLDEEGVTFIGRPNSDLGPDDPVNQPAYLEALTLCAAQSGIVDAMQEFQVSRASRDPDQIREDNEQFIRLSGCLRGKGWIVSDPVPDADGSLGPGDDFSGPDGDVDMDDIRGCISEQSLTDEGVNE
ncbi:MAG: hypothetical protein P8M16_09995 [Acidimicrobiales bacterium]|nr:hypothetical protein [Acidimicrobiales bacterium]